LETYKTSTGADGYNQQGIGTSSSMAILYKKGGSYGDLYTTDFARNADGSLKLYDGVPATSQDNKDSFKKYLGNMNAKTQLGWHNTFTYKGLSLYFLIDGKIGGKVISFTEAYLDRLGLSKRTGEARMLCEADMDHLMFQDSEGDWYPGMTLPDGQIAPIQKYYEQIGTLRSSEDYVYDGTNFRLRELSIGYTFKNLLGAGRNLSFSLIGRNLFFLYKNAPVDPETSITGQNGLGNIDIFNMPSARSFGLSASISF
ncbi:MAG: SusC/RagA family TonB-linked outer membrane protein, partial [Bacteroidaceae bacterium]